MMPMPPSPAGVDTAQMVSFSNMGVYYHKARSAEMFFSPQQRHDDGQGFVIK
jgi:hypothetical protein